MGGSIHDDARFLTQAESILADNWLGAYDQHTLIKGPGYPIWIAIVSSLGIPLLLAQHLLYVLMCAALVLALARRKMPFVLVACFALMLFNPSTSSPDTLRVLRCGVYPALALGVVAGAIGLYESAGLRSGISMLWAVFLGGVWTALWLTREEGIWLAPVLIAGLLAYLLSRHHPAGLRSWLLRLGIVLIPLPIWWVGVAGISEMNARYYRVPAPSEVQGTPFCDAYGAIASVKHAERKRYVLVPKEVRMRIYDVSPSFAQLEPYLEGESGRVWATYGRELIGSDEEIAGGFFAWALRDAVVHAGHYREGAETMAFYRAIANEIHHAADTGQLDCHTGRPGVVPRWHNAYAIPLMKQTASMAWDMLRFRHWQPSCFAFSAGSPEQQDLFTRVTGETLAPTATEEGVVMWIRVYDDATVGRLDRVRWDQMELPRTKGLRTALLGVITHGYRSVASLLLLLASLVGGCSVVRSFRRPHHWLTLIIPAGIIASVGARVLLLAYLDVTSFSAIRHQYIAPCYLLLLVFCCLMLPRAAEDTPDAKG